jgi:hypothetical protein
MYIDIRIGDLSKNRRTTQKSSNNIISIVFDYNLVFILTTLTFTVQQLWARALYANMLWHMNIGHRSSNRREGSLFSVFSGAPKQRTYDTGPPHTRVG